MRTIINHCKVDSIRHCEAPDAAKATCGCSRNRLSTIATRRNSCFDSKACGTLQGHSTILEKESQPDHKVALRQIHAKWVYHERVPRNTFAGSSSRFSEVN